MNKRIRFLVLSSIAIAAVVWGAYAFGGDRSRENQSEVITEITTTEQFTSILQNAGEKVLAFDLYAPWCSPCRILAPRLEKIAQEHQSKVTFYRINIDHLPEVAQAFRVNGIPLVAFVKNKTIMNGLVGLQPNSEYIAAINTLSAKTEVNLP